METALYYTFSTIPQVLAGAVALVGVFSLFRLDMFNSRLKGIVEVVLIEFERRPDLAEQVAATDKHLPWRLRKGVALGNFSNLKEDLFKVVTLVNTDSFDKDIRDEYDKYLVQRTKLIDDSKQALFVTGFSIACTVMVLPFSRAITFQYATCIFIGGIVLFLASLFFVGFTIVNSLKAEA